MMDKRSKQEHRLTFQNLDLAQELLHMCGQLGLRSVQRAARGERATSTFEHTLLLLLNTKKMMFSANTLDMQVCAITKRFEHVYHAKPVYVACELRALSGATENGLLLITQRTDFTKDIHVKSL